MPHFPVGVFNDEKKLKIEYPGKPVLLGLLLVDTSFEAFDIVSPTRHLFLQELLHISRSTLHTNLTREKADYQPALYNFI